MNFPQHPHESTGITMRTISHKLRDMILIALPDATENLNNELNVFSVSRKICYLKTTGKSVKLGFYGADFRDYPELNGLSDEEKCLCYVDITNLESIKNKMYSNILKSLAY